MRVKAWVMAVIAAGLGVAGCSSESRSPDAIRHDTARATGAVKRDGEAVVKGMWDGLRSKGPVNINKATVEQLETLPGVDEMTAERIVAGRPYETGGDLVRRRVLSRAEYGRISEKIVAR